MEFLDFVYIAATVDAGNFSKAAKSLGLNTSTVTRRISRLEDELGVSLFERGRTGARLTAGGRAMMPHVRRTLAELDAVRSVGLRSGVGSVGDIRLGVRTPPVGEPVAGLLARWREQNPDVRITIFEMNDGEIARALNERRLDVALTPSFSLWPNATAIPVYREQLVVALAANHPLAAREALDWASLADETILVQGWDESQAQREFFASLLGSGAKFQAHAASKESLLTLVGAGFGITFVGCARSATAFPGVVFIPISESNAWRQIELAWVPEAEEPTVGRFIAFMRDEARSRDLL